MAAPIELIRGNERQTLYSEVKVVAALADGWQRVSDLPTEKQRELADRPPIPWAGFDEMGVADVLARAAGLPPERIAEIVRYESATKGRVSITAKLTGTTPAPKIVSTEKVEAQLEAETGKDFTKTSNEPPTWAETDRPAPKSPWVTNG